MWSPHDPQTACTVHLNNGEMTHWHSSELHSMSVILGKKYLTGVYVCGCQALDFNPVARHDQDDWECRYGPCLNMCCLLRNDGSCADNLIANGGHYLPGGPTPVHVPGGSPRILKQGVHCSAGRRLAGSCCHSCIWSRGTMKHYMSRLSVNSMHQLRRG